LELLNYGGKLLIGDLKNLTKRNRFFASHTGKVFHQNFVQSDSIPVPEPINFPDFCENIDDGFIFGILQRYRSQGFESYLVPQEDDLPMANRREDILIIKN